MSKIVLATVIPLTVVPAGVRQTGVQLQNRSGSAGVYYTYNNDLKAASSADSALLAANGEKEISSEHYGRIQLVTASGTVQVYVNPGPNRGMLRGTVLHGALTPFVVPEEDFTLALLDFPASGQKVFQLDGNLAVTIPPNADVAIPVGSSIWFYTPASVTAALTLTPGSGVTLTDHPRTSSGVLAAAAGLYVRLLKTATNTWAVVEVSDTP